MPTGPSLPNVPPDHPLLQPGPAALRAQNNDAGSRVLQMQGLLAGLGYLDAARGLDGRFGPDTQTAVRNFQRDAGLTPDGVVGPRTLRALDAEFDRRLGLGADQPDAIRAAQGRLAGMGLLNGRGVDGIAGPVTQTSIYNFQGATVVVAGAPLIQDGILSPETVRAMQNPLANGLGPNPPNLQIEPGLRQPGEPGANGHTSADSNPPSNRQLAAPRPEENHAGRQTRPGGFPNHDASSGEAVGAFASPLGRELRIRTDSSGDGHFGARRSASRDGRGHHGVDWLAPVGTPVQAVDGGRVRVHPGSSTYGNWVEVDHGNGFSTRYAHLSHTSVQDGDTVRRGQTLGQSGITGNARHTTPHLHFEVRHHGAAVDPTELMGHTYAQQRGTGRSRAAEYDEQHRQGRGSQGQHRAPAPQRETSVTTNGQTPAMTPVPADPGQTSTVGYRDVFQPGAHSKPLGQLTAQESHELVRTVFGNSYGAKALIALDQANGNHGTLIQREIALGHHEGKLQFGRENRDPSSGYNFGTYQIGGVGSTRPESLAKYQRNLEAGIQLYQRQTSDQVDRSRLTTADKDVLCHLGFIESERRSHGGTIQRLADPNLSEAEVARLMSHGIQGGEPGIGRDVVAHMRGPVNLDAVRAREQEPAENRVRPITGDGARQEIAPELRQNPAARRNRATAYEQGRPDGERPAVAANGEQRRSPAMAA